VYFEEAGYHGIFMETGSKIASLLGDARRRTLQLVEDLTDEQLFGPRLRIINPLLWEIGHVSWFQEKWTLRHLRGEPSVRADADALWDSFQVAHDTRWDLRLPSREETLRYMRQVLENVIGRLPAGELSEDEAYFHHLVLFHEDMHDEAFTYTRQTLAYPAPALPVSRESTPTAAPPGGPWLGDVEVAGGTLDLGAPKGSGFVFDNEKWAHAVEVAPFTIAKAPVTNEEFAAFVDEGGYRRREWWSDEGWRRKAGAGAEHPVYWTRDDAGRWLERRFDRMIPLAAHHPVIHVSAHEAEAWCRWAARRLPTEAEWEMAACLPPRGAPKSRYPWGSDPPTAERANLDARAGWTVPVNACADGDSPWGCRQMIGNVWEWTSSVFRPYPGFVVDPYKEYSEPWFDGGHRVLRGGAWTTRSRLIRGTWRNFYTPDRRDVLAGFRTCARP
jgi:iron(II)-dependent oxidoreductase